MEEPDAPADHDTQQGGPAETDESAEAPGCCGCLLAMLLIGAALLLGYLDDRARSHKDFYYAERGQTFEIDLLSDLETAKGLSRLHDLRVSLRLDGLSDREVTCTSTNDSDFAGLKEIQSVSYKGVPLNSINEGCVFGLAAEIPDDQALDGSQGELVVAARVEGFYVDVGDRVVGTATGEIPIRPKSFDLEHAVPLRIVAPGERPQEERPYKDAQGPLVLAGLILALISGLRFLVSALRQPDAPAGETSSGA
jgi:hypothetical protein